MKTKVAKEEILELAWVLKERNIHDIDILMKKSREEKTDKLIESLKKDGYLIVSEGKFAFTEKGYEYAENIIRRLRLTEVLFTEILEMEDPIVRTQACEFEHILMEEVTDSICTFLGHPLKCPHGMPIPRGECCARFSHDIKPFVKPLYDLGIGELAKIVFMSPKTHARLDKLMTFGLTPGSIIKLHQKKPSFVVQIGETDLAIDSEIARNIYVRRFNGKK